MNYKKVIYSQRKRKEEKQLYYLKNKEHVCAKSRLWSKNNRDKNNKRRKNTVVRRQKSLHKLYISKRGCHDCGKVYPFHIYEFDHIDGSTRSSRIFKSIGMAFQRNLKILFREIRKTNIVCANCHKDRTYKRRKEGK